MAKKKEKAVPGGKTARLKIRKGDTVAVIAGGDRGLEGKVIAVYPDSRRVLVQGVNIIKKNTKVNYQGRRGAKEGGIVTQEAPVHVSNVALIDPETKRPTRAGYRRSEDGAKIRVARPSGKDI